MRLLIQIILQQLLQQLVSVETAYQRACADEPTIDEIRHENDRLCIKSSGNMNFAFSVDSSVRTIWNLNTGKIIYAVVE